MRFHPFLVHSATWALMPFPLFKIDLLKGVCHLPPVLRFSCLTPGTIYIYVIDSQIQSPRTDLFSESRPIANSLPHHLEISKVVRSTKEQNSTYGPGNQF